MYCEVIYIINRFKGFYTEKIRFNYNSFKFFIYCCYTSAAV